VIVFAQDSAFAACVCVQNGENGDADQAYYVDTFVAFDKRHRERERPVFVLVIDEGASFPNAKWRERIAEASRNINPTSLAVFVSASSLARGITTAINWIRPPTYKLAVVSDMNEAVTAIEAYRMGLRLIVQRLYKEARAEIDQRKRLRA
jgi:hypothetical protein